MTFPVTSGSHAPLEQGRSIAKRAIVWSNHPSAGNHMITLFQQTGLVVVERAHLQQIFNEQKIRLTHTSDDDSDILRVGKLVGADRVIFVEVTEKSQVIANVYYGAARSETAYNMSVAVRGVDVESGEIRWSGTAQTPRAINNPELAIVILSEAAVARALCPVESGYQWKERTREGEEAFCMKDGKGISLLDHKQAILPLL